MKIMESVNKVFQNILVFVIKIFYSASGVFCPSEYASSDLRLGARHVQCFMAFLGVATAYCLRVNLSVAIVPMTLKSSSRADAPELPWSEAMKGTILSSFYWGYLLLQVPGGQLAERFGPKFILVGALFISGLITVLTPFAAIYGGFYWMVFSRILQGAVQGFCYPSTNFLLAKWAPLPERGRLVTSVWNGDRFGTLVTMAVAGVLADHQGWPSVFYVSGGVAILWALVYSYVGANSPQDHKTISEVEKNYILDSLSDNASEREVMKTPWKAIATSVPMWALFVTHSGQNWGYLTMLTEIPSYINAVFGFDIQKSGFLSALPYLSSFIMGFVFATLCDFLQNKNIFSKTVSRKTWNTVALWGGALGFCLLSFAGEYEILALVLLIIVVALNAATQVGYHSNHLDLSPNFAGTLMGITNGFGNIASISAPIFAGFVLTDPTSLLQWRIVFLTSAGVFFVTNLIFVVFGSGEVQPWNFPPEKRSVALDDIRTEGQT